MNERQMVLKMLEEGKIDAEEAARLLEALRESPRAEQQTEKGGLADLPRVAGEMLQSLARELGDVLKDLPASIAGVVRELNRSVDVSLREDGEGICRLEIVGDRDNWRFRPAEDSFVRLEGKLHYSDRDVGTAGPPAGPSLRRDGDCLILELSLPEGFHHRLEGEFFIPAGMHVECRTRSGSLDVRGLSGDFSGKASLGRLRVREHKGQLKLRTRGGTIRVEDLEGSLDAEAKNGSVRAARIEGDSLLRCSNGLLELDDPGGSVRLSAGNGSLRVRYRRMPSGGEQRLESKTGMIQLAFAPDLKASVEARTRLGAVTLDPALDVERRGDRYLLGGGGQEIRVETGLGTIRLDCLGRNQEEEEMEDGRE